MMPAPQRLSIPWACCCLAGLTGLSARADFLGVAAVARTDLTICQDTSQDDIDEPLTVCNFFVAFDEPTDRLHTIAFSDITTSDPAGFFQFPSPATDLSPDCDDIFLFPGLVCDSFITIGVGCDDGTDGTKPDGDWISALFNTAGQTDGGWFNGNPANGQGDAGSYANNLVLFLQISTARGETVSGQATMFWEDTTTGEIFEEVVVIPECAGYCPADLNVDWRIGPFDLALLLSSWGPNPGNPADLDGDDVVGAADLAMLLAEWGPCCNPFGISDGAGPDADGDGFTDECDNCPELFNPIQNDCDEDGTGDACTIADGTSPDCNENEIPDKCEPGSDTDCNGNGIPDLCDLFDGVELDCNENGMADSCDIEPGGESDDCNQNGTPDECEIFVLTPGGPFFCLLDCAEDCNDNGIPDVCEIDAASRAPGGPFFCETECDPDCNDNGIPDECDAAGIPQLSPVVPVNSSAAMDGVTDRRPAIASDGAGTWAAAWTVLTTQGDEDIFFARSTDNGMSWSSMLPLNGTADTDSLDDQEVDIAYGGNTWIAVWIQDDGGEDDILYARSVDGVLTWSAPQNLTIGNDMDRYPHVATDGNGVWIMTWHARNVFGGPFGEDMDVYYRRSVDDGLTWSAPEVLNPDAMNDEVWQYEPAISTDRKGTWIITWTRRALGKVQTFDRDIMMARSTDNGLTFSEAQQVSNSIEADDENDNAASRIATNGSGTWVSVWRSREDLGGVIGTDTDILFSRSTDNGVSWSDTTYLNNSAVHDSADDNMPDVSAEGDHWVVVFHSRENFAGLMGEDPDAVYSTSADDGETWSTVLPLSSIAWGSQDHDEEGPVEVAGDGHGQFLAVWHAKDSLGGTIGEDRDILSVAVDWIGDDCNRNNIPDGCEIADGWVDDCNGNGVPDECEPDCNGNGQADSCDVADGISEDCNTNEVPDECEPQADCNGNDVQDICDLAEGISDDCNRNGIPDECESPADCNDNGVQDFCDIALGNSEDCNENVIPDECEPGSDTDCNSNGIPDLCDLFEGVEQDCNDNGQADSCDIADGISFDCDTNGVPDECDPQDDCNDNGVQDFCDIVLGTSEDCNTNEIPDECEPGADTDCNRNGIPDFCDLFGGAEQDCNENKVPDSCDLTDGTSEDCNGNTVPDECEPDCNGNDVADSCDIVDGTSADCDGNNVPDECQNTSTDCNKNGVWDACDIADGKSEDCDDSGVPDECEDLTGPQITEQPGDQEVEPGDLAFFGVGAEGLLLEYQWRKDGEALRDDGRILGSQTWLLVILEVIPEDAGEYDCVVSDGSGCSITSDSATLTVLPP